MTKSIHVSDDNWERLVILKARLRKRSFDEVISILLSKYQMIEISSDKNIDLSSDKMIEISDDRMIEPSAEEVPVKPTHAEEVEDVQQLIEEAVESVDAQKRKIVRVRKEIREVRTGVCPQCGEYGTPVAALYTGEWIHRLLVRCDGCDIEYVSYLGAGNLKSVSEFEKIKEKYPDCELVKYEDFLKNYKVIRGLSEE